MMMDAMQKKAKEEVLQKLISELESYMIDNGKDSQPADMGKLVEKATDVEEDYGEESSMEGSECGMGELKDELGSVAEILKKHFGNGSNVKPLREKVTIVSGRAMVPSKAGGAGLFGKRKMG